MPTPFSIALLALAPGVVPLPVGAPHADSLSASRISVEAERITVSLITQGVSWLEVLPTLDPDGDASITPTDLARERASMAGYLAQHYRLSADLRILTGQLGTLELEVAEEASIFGPARELILIEVEFPRPDHITELSVEVDLFLRDSPRHRDFSEILWDGRRHGDAQFSWDTRRASFAAPPPGEPAPQAGAAPAGPGGPGAGAPRADGAPAPRASGPSSPKASGAQAPLAGGAGAKGHSALGFSAFLRLGIEHILSGWDHLAFLLALLLSARSLRSVLWLVTAFSAAHSLTLALAALGHISLPSGLVECAIALSIALVAAENLWLGTGRSLWPEAFTFGLLHGLGFAGFLGDTLSALGAGPQGEGRSLLPPLIGFNLGVEAGQLAVALALVPLLRLMPRRQADAESRLAPDWLRRAGSWLLLGLGLALASGRL
ncbi:MAG TPA: HupE/UreJ family protein [Planctomycetota bacterium]|nr:HupE/UreJ family protein [Planctomycetota bacterium]